MPAISKITSIQEFEAIDKEDIIHLTINIVTNKVNYYILDITKCVNMESFVIEPTCVVVKLVGLDNCTKLNKSTLDQTFVDTLSLENLKELTIGPNYMKSSFPIMTGCTELISINSRKAVMDLTNLPTAENLEKLRLKNTDDVTVPVMPKLKSIKTSSRISNVSDFKNMDGITVYASQSKYSDVVRKSPQLKSLKFVFDKESMRRLYFDDIHNKVNVHFKCKQENTIGTIKFDSVNVLKLTNFCGILDVYNVNKIKLVNSTIRSHYDNIVSIEKSDLVISKYPNLESISSTNSTENDIKSILSLTKLKTMNNVTFTNPYLNNYGKKLSNIKSHFENTNDSEKIDANVSNAIIDLFSEYNSANTAVIDASILGDRFFELITEKPHSQYLIKYYDLINEIHRRALDEKKNYNSIKKRIIKSIERTANGILGERITDLVLSVNGNIGIDIDIEPTVESTSTSPSNPDLKQMLDNLNKEMELLRSQVGSDVVSVSSVNSTD